jgi:hypothetical protein
MLYFFTGTDTDKVRTALSKAIEEHDSVIRITDAHSLHDLSAALQGGGMFGPAQPVVLDHIYSNDEMWQMFLSQLERLRKDALSVYVLESTPDASTRKTLEKYSEKTVRHDAAKKDAKDNFFGLVNALQQGKKKDLWVLLQAEFAGGKAPEAVHGSLFWAAKQQHLRAGNEKSARLVARLAELPHEARRQGFELEYALERFALSEV